MTKTQEQMRLVVQGLIERPSREAIHALSTSERILDSEGYYEYANILAQHRLAIEISMTRTIDAAEGVAS